MGEGTSKENEGLEEKDAWTVVGKLKGKVKL